jgi:sporulation protein YlmC with PRC-barrel domain
MTSLRTLALSSTSRLCFALVLLTAGPALASEPNSTPAEQAQTQQLNQNISNANAAAEAQSTEKNAVYQAQQDRYLEQLRVYRASQTNYVERAASYQAARDRYIASHAAYHRTTWPARYEQRLIVDTTDLLGADVHTANGRTVGHVVEIALTSGRVEALRVSLNSSRGDVWIEAADLRFDADKKVVMTNLNRTNIYEMTRETY